MPSTIWNIGAIAPRLEALSERWANHDLSERASLHQKAHSVEEMLAEFSGAKEELVARHLETLAMMGEITLGSDNRYRPAHRVA